MAAPQKVAFSAAYHAHKVTGQAPGKLCKFDNILLNEGGGYDSMTGIFTAPCSGTYCFYIKIQVGPGEGHSMDLKHQGESIGHIFAKAPGGGDICVMSDTQEIVRLNKGDKVWVETGGYSDPFTGSYASRFNGFLIHT